jgi:carbonic anhydrase
MVVWGLLLGNVFRVCRFPFADESMNLVYKPIKSMSEISAIVHANAIYAQTFGEKGSLPLPPARKIAILTCMDARLDPAKFAGLNEGDAHVIRNAGGRASDDAIRSLVISYKLLGTNEWFVIHHSNCGMEFFTDEGIRSLLANSLETAVLGDQGFSDVGQGPGSKAGEFINWLTISDQCQSVVDDVRRIRDHALVPSRIPIYGFIYQVETGLLIEIEEASSIGTSVEAYLG